MSLQITYIIAVVLWILIIYALEVYKHKSPIGYVILGIPLFVYAIGFLSVGKINKSLRREMFKGDVLSVTLLFVTVLFNSISRDTHYTINIMLVASVLVVLSLVDIWTGEKTLELAHVIRSIFQTAAITLLVYVLFIRFTSGYAFVTTPKDHAPVIPSS